jgi:hypothetical protein
MQQSLSKITDNLSMRIMFNPIAKTKKKQSISAINNQLTVEIGSSCRNALYSQDMPKKTKRD